MLHYQYLDDPGSELLDKLKTRAFKSEFCHDENRLVYHSGAGEVGVGLRTPGSYGRDGGRGSPTVSYPDPVPWNR